MSQWTDWKLPGTAVNEDVFGGNEWWNPSGVTTSAGNSIAFVSQPGSGTGNPSNAIKATNFQFDIPSSAVIQGIEFRINRSWYVGFFSVSVFDYSDFGGGDRYPRLVVNGSYDVQGPQSISWFQSPSNNPVTFRLDTFGSESSLFGYELTPELVNASNFGVIVLPTFESGPFGADPDAFIDYIEMRINYELSEPGVQYDLAITSLKVDGIIKKYAPKFKISTGYLTPSNKRAKIINED